MPGMWSTCYACYAAAGLRAFTRFAQKEALVPVNFKPTSMASARSLWPCTTGWVEVLSIWYPPRCSWWGNHLGGYRLWIIPFMDKACCGLRANVRQCMRVFLQGFYWVRVLKCVFFPPQHRTRFEIWKHKKFMPNTYDYRRVSAGSCCGCMGYNYSEFDRCSCQVPEHLWNLLMFDHDSYDSQE